MYEEAVSDAYVEASRPFAGQLWTPDEFYSDFTSLEHRRLELLDLMSYGVIALEHSGHKAFEGAMVLARKMYWGDKPWPGMKNPDPLQFHKILLNFGEMFVFARSMSDARYLGRAKTYVN